MTVEVRWPGIRRVWARAEGGEFVVELRGTRSAGGGEDELLESVRALVEDVNSRFLERHGVDDAPWAEPAVWVAGAVQLALYPRERGVTRAWVQELAAALGQAGWSGSLGAARASRPPEWSNDPTATGFALTVFLQFTPQVGVAHRVPEGVMVDMAEEDLEVLKAVARGWGTSPACGGIAGSTPYLGRDEFSARTAPEGAVDAWVEGARRYVTSRLTWVHGPTRHARGAVLSAGAKVALGSVRPGQPWADRLTGALDVLRRLGPRLEVAAVRTTESPHVSWHRTHGAGPVPPVGSTDQYRDLRLQRRFVLDAYGAQVLTDAHLARAADLSSWVVEPLGNGRHLVTHPDPQAWFGQPPPEPTDTPWLMPWREVMDPDPDVLAQARRDFGPLTLTEADYAAFRQADLEERRSRR